MSQTIQTTDTLNAGRIKINDNFALPNFGVWNYNNSLASQSIPLNVWTKVNNNGAGASTYLGGALSGVTIYDTTNYQFDYTDLSLYDSVDIRFDANVTTTSANQEVRVRLLLSVGSLNIPLTFIDNFYKTVGTYPILGLIQNHIFTNDIKNNPAQFEIHSDANFTLATNGWAIKVNKRLV
jgi:hypothetical protein